MKNLIIAGIFSLVSLPTFAQIQFEQGSWADVKAKAKKENKYIFVDAFTEWCGPCKAMAKNVFPAKEVGDFYNKNFVSYKFDMEKGEGEQFAKTYQVNAYPTLVYFSPTGEMVHKGIGGRSNEGFIELGENAINPEKQYYTLKAKFEKGEKSKDFLENLVKSAQEAGDEETLQKLAPKIVRDMPESEWSNRENAQVVFQAIIADEEILEKVIKMRPEFEKSVGAEEFNLALLNTLNTPLSNAINAKDEKLLDNIRKKLHKMLPPEDAKIMEARLDAAYYQSVGNEEKAKKANEKFDELQSEKIKNNPEKETWSSLNTDAWNVYENLKNKNLTSSDKKMITDAIVSIKKSIEMERNFYNVDTYAHLLFLSGNKEEAITQIKEAIKLGKMQGENTTDSEASLKKWTEK